ncbi:hypothetical protein FB451DRAFT_1265247 [Mycena latifolia]|nr:hypothetical protein FB451DRAFT_1265247 [Mycena latifolia]
MSSIPLHGSMLLGCALESMGYGVLTVMTGFTLKSLRDNTQTRYPSRLLLTVLFLIWILSTGHWITNVYRAYQAFVRFPGGPILFYSTTNLGSYTARNIVYCTLVMVADSFAVYRCYRVWNNKWYVVVIPIIMVGGSAVTGYGTTYFFTVDPPGGVFGTTIVRWGTSWFAMNLCTNLVCTCIVGSKILLSQRSIRTLSQAASQRLWNTLIIILESAAIYSSVLIVLITCYLVGSFSAYTVLDISVSTVGITFTMIILRVSLGVNSDTRYYGETTAETMRLPTRSGDVTVNVSRLVEVTGDSYSAGEESGKSTFTQDMKPQFDRM